MFREAREADHARLAEIYVEVFSKDAFYSDFLEFLITPKSYLIVAEIDHQIVGFGASDINGEINRTYLYFGMIAPTWQRRGIGSSLFLLRLALSDDEFDPAMVAFNATSDMRDYYIEKFGSELIGPTQMIHGTEIDTHGLWVSSDQRSEIFDFLRSLPITIQIDQSFAMGDKGCV